MTKRWGMCTCTHQAWLVQTDYTVSLPGFPTLLSAEGDFLIIAGSMHVTYNTFNNTTQSRRREDTGEKRWGKGGFERYIMRKERSKWKRRKGYRVSEIHCMCAGHSVC